MNIENEIKQAEQLAADLKAKLAKQQEVAEYGRRALTIDESEWAAHIYQGIYPTLIEHKMHLQVGRCFTTKAAAIRFNAAERLAQECRVAMTESWGGEKVEWNTDNKQDKFSLYCVDGHIDIIHILGRGAYLEFSFKEHDHAQAFIDKHCEEAVRLMVMGGDV